jgi:hypothetical protein
MGIPLTWKVECLPDDKTLCFAAFKTCAMMADNTGQTDINRKYVDKRARMCDKCLNCNEDYTDKQSSQPNFCF